MNYGLLSLLPPVVAVILAIWSKNVILSLFCGGFVGAMIFCGGNPFAAVHSMIGDYFFIVYKGLDHQPAASHGFRQEKIPGECESPEYR